MNFEHIQPRSDVDLAVRVARPLRTDRVTGEIAIGTNYHIGQYAKNVFFDEKIGDTFHLALDAGYPETGNMKVSGLHGDMVLDPRRGCVFAGSPGRTTHADGELIQQEGRFVAEGWPGTDVARRAPRSSPMQDSIAAAQHELKAPSHLLFRVS